MTEFEPKRPPRVMGGSVLYLDFDGALHHEDVRGGKGHRPKLGPLAGAGRRLFEHAGLLQELLAAYPQVRIVLSTSWVRVKGYSYCVGQLPANLQARCCGATWHSGMQPARPHFESMMRGHQVLADVLRRKPQRWLAIDDDDSGWAWAEAHYIRSDPAEGIAEPAVLERLKARLAEEFASTPEESDEDRG